MSPEGDIINEVQHVLSDYSKALEAAGIRTFLIGGLWPTPEVTPEKLGTSKMTGAYIDYLEAHLKGQTTK